jgi:P-type Cu2+ transporter
MRQAKQVTVVLDVHPILRGSEKAVVEAKLGRRPGVERVEANPVAQTATVTYDPAQTSLTELRRWVQECGLHCDGQSVPEHICDPLLEPDPADGHGHHAAAEAPAPAARPDHHHQEVAVQPASGHAGHAPVGEAMRSPHEAMGHGGHGAMSMAAMTADMRNRFLVAAAFSVPILLWSPIGRDVLGFQLAAPFGLRDDVWSLLLSLPVIFYSCWIFFDGAVRALRARTLDMMVLVAVAVGAGWGYSVVVTLTGGGEVFYEAASVLATFVLLGHWLEMRARGGANDAIHALLDLAPPKALVLPDGEPVEVPSAEVQVGDLLLVRPGAKIATDGVVEDGDSEVDESVVTGESLPVHRQPGDQVIGATINRNGTLRVRATKVGADTALAQIVKLVQEAQNSKAPGQQLADRAAFWLVLVALVGGGATLVAWLLAGRPFSEAILFAITVVVIACPDALGLATPMAIMIGTGLGAKRGILFKNAVALETAARVDTVVMDKTGTLTKGEPFENVPGHGAVATVQGRRVVVGNRRLMDREQVDLGPLAARREQLASDGRTVVIAATDGRPLGLFAIADAPRETSVAAIRALHDAEVQVVMLTGDNQATAERIASQLGIDQVIAEVLPGDKAAKIAELQQDGRKVAMVGDGVNDAPALARADLGIAIGAGTDVAIETADVVLIRSDPVDVATALTIGRGTLRKERQNLGWAVGYNAVALPIAAGVFEPAFGLVLRPEIAALSMSGSSLLVAVNALTLKRLRLPQTPPPAEPPQPAGRGLPAAEATP